MPAKLNKGFSAVSTRSVRLLLAPGSNRPPTVPRVAVGSAAAKAALPGATGAPLGHRDDRRGGGATQVEGVEAAAVEAQMQRRKGDAAGRHQALRRDGDIDDGGLRRQGGADACAGDGRSAT